MPTVGSSSERVPRAARMSLNVIILPTTNNGAIVIIRSSIYADGHIMHRLIIDDEHYCLLTTALLGGPAGPRQSRR